MSEAPNNSGSSGPSKNDRKRGWRPAFSEPPKIFEGKSVAPNFFVVKNSETFLEIVEDDSGGKDVSVLMGTSKGVDICDQMREIVNDLATEKFQEVVFMEVDVEECKDLATSQKLEAMPTFIIYRDKKAVDRIEGAFPEKLKAALYKATGQKVTNGGCDCDRVPGNGEDLIHYVDMKKSECLNCSDETPFEDFVTGKGNLVSDCDEELLLTIGFNQDVVLHSFKIKAPIDTGPKVMKIFTNQLNSLDFDDAKSFTPTYIYTLSTEDLLGESLISFDRWKFHRISDISFYISENQNGSDITTIHSVTLFGEAVDKKKGVTGRTVTVAGDLE